MELKTAKVYKKLLWQDPDRMNGAVCFYGTRIPVTALFDGYRAGESLEDFLATFPHLDPQMVSEVLELASSDLESHLKAA